MWISTPWINYIETGDKLFQYMVNNFETFFADESTVKSFGLRNGDNCISSLEYEELNAILQKDGDGMQKELIPWIRKELDDGHLFKRENWNPFREYEPCGCPGDTYFGYRRMFLYKEYYCQLSIETICWIWRITEECDCEACKENTYIKHFELSIWGWNNEKFQNSREINKFATFPDDIIPDREWNIEKRIHPDRPTPPPPPSPKVKEIMPTILIGDVISGSLSDYFSEEENEDE
jgi:hypothetical protein